MQLLAKRLAWAAVIVALLVGFWPVNAQSGPNLVVELQRGLGGNTELYQFAPGAAGGQLLADAPANLSTKLSPAGGAFQTVFGYDPAASTYVIRYGPRGGATQTVNIPKEHSVFYEPVFDTTGAFMAFTTVGPIDLSTWTLNLVRLADGVQITFEGRFTTQEGQQNSALTLGVPFPLEGWTAAPGSVILLGSAIPYTDGNFAGYNRMVLPDNLGGTTTNAPMPNIERLSGLPISMYQPLPSGDYSYIAFATSDESKVTDWIGAYGPQTGVRVVGGFSAFATQPPGTPVSLSTADVPVPAGFGVGGFSWGPENTLYYTVGQFNQSSSIQNVQLVAYQPTSNDARTVGNLTNALGLAVYEVKVCGETIFYTVGDVTAQQPDQILFSAPLGNIGAPTELTRAVNIRLRECR